MYKLQALAIASTIGTSFGLEQSSSISRQQKKQQKHTKSYNETVTNSTTTTQYQKYTEAIEK